MIHVLPDEAMQCQAILQSMLPRESNSKVSHTHSQGPPKFTGPGAQTISPEAQQYLVGTLQKISLNIFTRRHYHISFIALMETYINQ